MHFYLQYFIGAVVGFLLFNYTNRGVNKCPKFGKTLQVYDSKGKCFHIHHWIIFCLVSLVLVAIRPTIKPAFPYLFGFCIGALIQGLTYSDAFKVKQDCRECYHF